MAVVVGVLILGLLTAGALRPPKTPDETKLGLAVAGSWLGFVVAWFGLRWRGRTGLVGASAVGSGLLHAALTPLPEGLVVTFLLTTVIWGGIVYGLPLALVLYGFGVGAEEDGAPAPRPVRPAPSPSAAPRAPAPPAELERPVLWEDEQRVRERLAGIEAQRERLDAAGALLDREAGSPALAPVREKLAFARGVLREQEARHVARLWAVELVRWKHRLAPLAADLAESDPAEAGRRLDALTAVAREGEALLRGWEAVPETAATEEGRRCVAYLRDLLARCEGIRQEIVVQQAMLAIRGITPSDDAAKSAGLSVAPLDELRAELDAGSSLEDALAEFDSEHSRLQGDREAAREVERFLSELQGGRP